jgi:hypothetical protein
MTIAAVIYPISATLGLDDSLKVQLSDPIVGELQFPFVVL